MMKLFDTREITEYSTVAFVHAAYLYGWALFLAAA
jgi:hypothetical protein